MYKLDGIQTWLEEILLKQKKSPLQRTAELTDGWKRSGQFCIEWKPTTTTEQVTELTVLQKHYTLTGWLKRIQVFDDDIKDVPDWLKKINVSNFHQSCGENPEQPCIVENITHVPKWLQRMDVCHPPGIKRHNKNIFPSWMQRLNVFDSRNVPSIDLKPRDNYDVTVSPWLEKLYTCEIKEEQARKRMFVPTSYSDNQLYGHVYDENNPQDLMAARRRKTSSSSSIVNNVQYLCNSMINIAAVLATATCNYISTAEKPSQSGMKVNGINSNTGRIQRKKSVIITGQQELERKKKAWETANVKKNKKSMKRMNSAQKIRKEKKKKHSAKAFNGGKCVRAR